MYDWFFIILRHNPHKATISCLTPPSHNSPVNPVSKYDYMLIFSHYTLPIFHFNQDSNQVKTHPSTSTSLIISASSASVGFCPRDLITVPNSLVVMVPSPSLSKRLKASLNSAICSSVSWSAIVLLWVVTSKGQSESFCNVVRYP